MGAPRMMIRHIPMTLLQTAGARREATTSQPRKFAAVSEIYRLLLRPAGAGCLHCTFFHTGSSAPDIYCPSFALNIDLYYELESVDRKESSISQAVGLYDVPQVCHCEVRPWSATDEMRLFSTPSSLSASDTNYCKDLLTFPPLPRSPFRKLWSCLCREWWWTSYSEIKHLNPRFPFMIRPNPEGEPYLLVEYGESLLNDGAPV